MLIYLNAAYFVDYHLYKLHVLHIYRLVLVFQNLFEIADLLFQLSHSLAVHFDSMKNPSFPFHEYFHIIAKM